MVDDPNFFPGWISTKIEQIKQRDPVISHKFAKSSRFASLPKHQGATHTSGPWLPRTIGYTPWSQQTGPEWYPRPWWGLNVRVFLGLVNIHWALHRVFHRVRFHLIFWLSQTWIWGYWLEDRLNRAEERLNRAEFFSLPHLQLESRDVGRNNVLKDYLAYWTRCNVHSGPCCWSEFCMAWSKTGERTAFLNQRQDDFPSDLQNVQLFKSHVFQINRWFYH